MKRFLLICLLIVPQFLKAQVNLKKGYVIASSRDTLKGFIDYKERDNNPRFIKFRSAENEKVRTFDVQNCTGFTIEQIVSYQRFLINISKSTEDIRNLPMGVDLTFRRDTVFLKVLQVGANITLFSYKDDVKTRYYIKENSEEEPQELIRNVFYSLDEEHVVVHNNRFLNQLVQIKRKYKDVNTVDESKLSNIKFNEADFVKFAADVNGEQVTKSKYKSIRFYAGAGLNISKTSYSGTNEILNVNTQNKTSYLPMLTAGIDVFANPAIGKLIYRLELALMASKNKIYTTNVSQYIPFKGHSFDQITAAFIPQVIYNFYNTSKLKVFAGAGVGLSFSSYSNNETTTTNSFRNETEVQSDQVIFEKFNFSPNVRAGFVLNRKIEFSTGYFFNSPITDYVYYNVNIQRFAFGINYLFGKH